MRLTVAFDEDENGLVTIWEYSLATQHSDVPKLFDRFLRDQHATTLPVELPSSSPHQLKVGSETINLNSLQLALQAEKTFGNARRQHQPSPCSACKLSAPTPGYSLCAACYKQLKTTPPPSLLDFAWKPKVGSAAAVAGVAGDAAGNKKKQRVLLFVDDEPDKIDNQQLAAKAHERGVRVVQVTSTADALAKLDRFAEEIAAFDFRVMTDMTRVEDGKKNTEAGIELIRALHPRRPPWPVLLYCFKEQNLAAWTNAFPSGLRCTTAQADALAFASFQN